MPVVFRGSFFHLAVSGQEENITVENPTLGVPDSHFGTKYSADGVNIMARECAQSLTKCQQTLAE
jgi:hypothetical protein